MFQRERAQRVSHASGVGIVGPRERAYWGAGGAKPPGKKSGAPCRTRTCDLLVRSQTLYPTELRAHAADRTNFRVYHNDSLGKQVGVGQQRLQTDAERGDRRRVMRIES